MGASTVEGANRRADLALVVSLVGLVVSGLSVYVAYRTSEVQRLNLLLQAAQVETRVTLRAWTDGPNSEKAVLRIRVANLGAPTVIKTVGFSIAEGDDGRHRIMTPACFSNLNLPRKLERNDGLDITLRASEMRKWDERKRPWSLIAQATTGLLIECEDPQAVRAFLLGVE